MENLPEVRINYTIENEQIISRRQGTFPQHSRRRNSKRFLNKQLAVVEDEHGFDVPVLISECVLVESAGNEKLGQAPEDQTVLQDKKTFSG